MSNVSWPTKIGSTVSTTSNWTAPEVNAAKAAINSKLELELSATYAAISSSVIPRLVRVAADETNNGLLAWYIHTGTALELFNFLTP